jgi:hypothetical protein
MVVKRNGISFPVAQDNRFRPMFYLVDKKGS